MPVLTEPVSGRSDGKTITAAKTPAVTLDPKKVAALQAKVSRFVGAGALAAAPHTYHH